MVLPRSVVGIGPREIRFLVGLNMFKIPQQQIMK